MRDSKELILDEAIAVSQLISDTDSRVYIY